MNSSCMHVFTYSTLPPFWGQITHLGRDPQSSQDGRPWILQFFNACMPLVQCPHMSGGEETGLN